MSHFEQKKFVEFSLDELKKKNNFNNLSVLDVGSYDVGGSIRDFFKKNNYIGVDLIKGPNVDIVLSGTELYKLKKNFDIVISCECFEHAKDWREIFLSMHNVCEDDGYVIFTCASRGRIEHGTLRTINSDSPGTTGTYYKNIFKSEFIKSF
ncbi:methyltransferase domain-containing protein, partial [Candidatus Pelagibacter sp.]|nr:methyltransferase domain-containing protein [Candidatus Pelagibacter sp.]